jgi:DNA repair exonuclease SbcCD nuclease subunit
MKLLITSDWHLDAQTAGIPRFDDLSKVLDEIVKVAINEKIDTFLFLGDLTNPESVRSHRAVARAHQVSKELNSWFIDNYWLVGNHDVIENGANDNTLMSLDYIHRLVHSISQPSIIKNNGIYIVGLPFTPRSHSYDPAEFINNSNLHNSDNLPIIVISHLNIEGIEPGSETKDFPRGRDVFLPLKEIRKKWPNALIFNGHYHRRQIFKGVQIPGSIIPLTFGEENNETGYLICEV